MSDNDSALRQEIKELRELVELLRKQNEPRPTTETSDIVQKELPKDVLEERESFAEDVLVPGHGAPVFSLVDDFLSIGVVPWGDPLVPAYLLDKNYRIVDWNSAFGLAFDHTMDGRRGLSVLEWVYFLDNYEESLTQSAKDFADPENLPRLHIETIKYTSLRYGQIVSTKRAYQIPNDQEELLGWLITLDVNMEDVETTLRYKRDLFGLLRRDMTWTDYALSYDIVLLASRTYLDLLSHILGERIPAGGTGSLEPIRPRSRILDLGAGSGNVSRLLAEQQRGHTVFAVENNRGMLDLLYDKCAAHLRSDDDAPGVLAIKQDVNVLFGLPENSFDYAILNNVAYTLEDPLLCLRQACAALKANGEIRVSGPQKSTNLETLFSQIGDDLRIAGRMDELKSDFDKVWDINQNELSSILYRWDTTDVANMLLEAGFREIVYSTDSAYAGQAMIVVARK